MARFAVILPAAGKSSRFGGPEKKAFLPLADRAVWEHATAPFAGRADVAQILLVLAAEDREAFQRRFADSPLIARLTLVPGGAERFESVANAIGQLASAVDHVAVHDAARPCLTADLVERVFAKSVETGAAMLAVPVADTVKQADDEGRVQATLSRRGLWLAQTPQVFRRDWLEAAYAGRDRLGRDITDDAQLVEASGRVVHLVAGSPANLKITTAADFGLAEAMLRPVRLPEARC